MNSFLMHRDRNFTENFPEDRLAESTFQDLEMELVLRRMAGKDKLIYDVSRKALLHSETSIDTILYRQATLKDCIESPEGCRSLYQTVKHAYSESQTHYFWLAGRSPVLSLYEAAEVMRIIVGVLRDMKNIMTKKFHKLQSESLVSLNNMLKDRFDDLYLDSISYLANELKFNYGIRVNLRLGVGNVGKDYRLLSSRPSGDGVMRIISGRKKRYTVTVDPQDLNGSKALGDIKERALEFLSLNVSKIAENVIRFLSNLRNELAFYVGCLNLHDELMRISLPTCFPLPLNLNDNIISYSQLRDASLALRIGSRVVGNDLAQRSAGLIFISGLNKGGKSTLLRSIGQAILMMQAGMFVVAENFSASISGGLFTHFRREEDKSMVSGKLDEELSRMAEIVSSMKEGSTVLFNESFSATNVREGSKIAQEIIDSLLTCGTKVIFVTHNYDLTNKYLAGTPSEITFLQPIKNSDGSPTFMLKEGKPEGTSYGMELFRQVFK